MKHLTPEEFVDAADGMLPAARRAHLDVCEECRQEAAALRSLMTDVRDVNVPEPSPLFWDHFSARVAAAITHEDRAGSARAARWFEWPVLAPFAALTVLVVALVSFVSPAATPPAADATISTESPDAADFDMLAAVDSDWLALADMVGELDVETAHEAGIGTRPGTADEAVWQLSLAEQQELLRLLREELRAGG